MDYWNEVIKLALKAAKKGEVPVGAILVYKNRIIARGYNKREKSNNILGHAEIQVIKKANKCLHCWKLDDCELYVSLKPCSMCEEIIKQSRLKNVYYLLEKPTQKKEYYKTEFIKDNNYDLENEYKAIMTNFFKKMR